ncbi:MAG: metallophosphoesterase [Candidatus Gastranaerophilaceae bacterium]
MIDTVFNFFDLIEITRQTIKLPDSKKLLKGIKVAHISDLHINMWNISLIDESIEKMNSLNPDIVVIAGDLICSGKKFLPDLFSILKKIKSKYGIYACFGNHDYSDGDSGQEIVRNYNKSNIRVLNNESQKITIKNTEIYIAGIDDYHMGHQDFKKTFKNIPDEEKCLLLTHNPVNFEELSSYNPLVVFAGHTHGGQLYLPFVNQLYKKFLNHKYIRGRHEHNNSILYVNRGIGTSMFSDVIFKKKIYFNTPRFNSKPEITLFDFA